MDNNRTNKGRTAIRPILNRSGDNRNLRDNSNRMAQHQIVDEDYLTDLYREGLLNDIEEEKKREGFKYERRYDE